MALFDRFSRGEEEDEDEEDEEEDEETAANATRDGHAGRLDASAGGNGQPTSATFASAATVTRARAGGTDTDGRPVVDDWGGDSPRRDPSEATWSAHPTLKEFGRLGAHYLLFEPSWVRRHVETISLKNLQSARRRITIDVLLPREPECVALHDGERSLYFMPVTILAKQPITSYIDFVDEADRSLPLLTRGENATVSLAAVIEAGRRLSGEEPSRPLRRAWAEVVRRDGLEAALALLVADDLLTRRHPDVKEKPRYAWFMQALRDLAANSLVWLPLRGHGGERRIVKLRYDATAGPLKLRPQRDTTIYVEAVLEDGLTHEFELTEPGDWDPRTTLGRVANRIGNTLGLTAMSVGLTTPYIRGSNSYHLQVEAPLGLEIQRLSPFTRLRRRGSRQAPSQALVENDGDSAHLYMSGAEVSEMQPAVIDLHVGRRGFLSLSTLSGLLIVAMLWAYDIAAPINLANSHPEVAAAVLLVVPVLLLAFAVRLSEHPYATRMLLGVRVFMLTLGLLAVADAAAIVGVKPLGWGIHHTWFVYAVAGSIVSGVLVLGWLLALRTTKRVWDRLNSTWESRASYMFCCAAAGALTCIALGVGDLDAETATSIPELGVGLPLALVLLCWTLVSAPASRETRLPAGLCWLSGVAAIAASGFLLAGSIEGVRWHGAWEVLAPMVAAATVLLLLCEATRYVVDRVRAGRRDVGVESS